MRPGAISTMDDYQALINSVFCVGTGSLPWLETEDLSTIMTLKVMFAQNIEQECLQAEFANVARLIFNTHHSRQDMR